jgi:hypothetical protein
MRTIVGSCCVVLFTASAVGESPDPPIADTRLSVHTLVREDIFAGWLSNDMERFARGEKNIDLLLAERPRAKAELLAWKGGATLFRAVLAREAGDNEAFERNFQKAFDLLGQAKKLAPRHPAVAAVVGGSYVVFADRLPEKYRDAAWAECYDNYQALWKQQAGIIEKLPEHIRGELLAGLAQAAERTGRKEELAVHLDKIVEVLPDTEYARVAKQWKDDPQAAATGAISCKICHDDGRLAARLAKLNGK